MSPFKDQSLLAQALDDGLLSSNGTKGSVISSKLSRVLTSSYADPELRNALETISGGRSLSSYNYENRRKLQIETPWTLLESDGSILAHFKDIAEYLRELGMEIESMTNTCRELRKNICNAEVGTKAVVEESQAILERKDCLEQKLHILNGFTKKFNITEDELAVIAAIDHDIDEKFFDVVLKLKVIHENCQLLLANEDTKAGLDVMEEMTKSLHIAFQRLHVWVQGEFRNMSFDNPSLSSEVKRALRVLGERPVLLQNCLDLLADARQKVLYQNFMDALTNIKKVGSGSLPIEMTAHDPLRYVGDMLAWLHSTMVGELETLDGLFSTDGSRHQSQAALTALEPDMEVPGRYFNEKEAIMSLTAKDLNAINKPLQARIEHVIITNNNPVVIYKLINLMGFYRETFGTLVGRQCEVYNTMTSLLDSCRDSFHTSLTGHVKARTHEPSHIPANFTPPSFLIEAIADIQVLLSCLDTSLAPVADPGAEIKLILHEALKPYLDLCQSLASDLEIFDSQIFVTNCYSAVLAILEKYNIPEDYMNTLTNSMGGHVDALVTWQHEYLLERSGLKLFYANTSINQVEKLSVTLFEKELSSFSVTLEQFLPLASIEARFQLRNLSSSSIKASVADAAARRFLDDCSTLRAKAFELLSEDKASVVFPITIEEIKTLVV